jgi:N-acetylneuraminate synthase
MVFGDTVIGEGKPVFLVAEIANAHEGSIETAKKMVDALKGSGVDSIKFQLHIHDAEMLPTHPKFLTQQKRSLTLAEIIEIKKYTEEAGFYFLCTPFSREAADQLESIGVDAFKIGSGEVTNPLLMEHIAQKGKPTILSTGMTELDELDETVAIFKKYGTPYMLLHSVSEYPPTYAHLNLGAIASLRERYGVPVGLSDHTPEIYSAIAAIPFQAALIEKHYTLDRNTVGTSDHKVSLEPNEWKTLVDAVRKIEQACGSDKKILDDERAVMDWAKQSLIALQDIPEGTVITKEMVWAKRPLGKGIPAKHIHKVLGKKATRTIDANTQLFLDDISL